MRNQHGIAVRNYVCFFFLVWTKDYYHWIVKSVLSTTRILPEGMFFRNTDVIFQLASAAYFCSPLHRVVLVYGFAGQCSMISCLTWILFIASKILLCTPSLSCSDCSWHDFPFWIWARIGNERGTTTKLKNCQLKVPTKWLTWSYN